jgi:hypothetical protein
MNKKVFSVLLLLSIGLLFADTGVPEGPTSKLYLALKELCSALRTLVPVAAMLMVLFAAVVYATGQMMGAETRARANVWATSALTGAVIGILISVIAPAVLSTMSSQTVDC